MKEKKWQKFTVQSVVLLAVVLAFSIFRQGGFVRESGKKVMADVTTVLNETKVPEETQEPEKLAESVKSVKSDMVHIKRRSHTYIEIPKSAITTGAGIYLYDNYMDSEVCIVIDGTIQKGSIIRYNRGSIFTGSANVKNKKDIVKNIETVSSKTEDGLRRTEVKITTKRLYAPELYETDSSYYISLAIPKDIYDKLVVIDAGHGGIDEGTKSFRGHCEKDYNLMVLKELKSLLDTSDIKAYYTRLSDEKVSKAARTRLANSLDADLFISIHCNSAEYGDGEPYGVEALYSKRKPANSELDNKKLAEILLENVAEKVNSKKRGVIRREGLYIMHHSNVPASIIEIGYMSNKSDLKYIIKKSGQKKAAEGIYNGILEALG